MTEPMSDRFWNRVEKGDGCWPWQGEIHPRTGYGRVFLDGRYQAAHRVAFSLAGGTIPPGMALDHLCNNRSCVRPEHLEPVTWAENNRRGRIRRKACRKGHPRTPENVYLDRSYADGFVRWRCRPCNRAAVAAYGARKRAPK